MVPLDGFNARLFVELPSEASWLKAVETGSHLTVANRVDYCDDVKLSHFGLVTHNRTTEG